MNSTRPPRTLSRSEWIAQGLIAANLFGWLALIPFAVPTPTLGIYVIAAILSMPIAWPIPLVYRAVDSLSHVDYVLVIILTILVVFPWLWLNAVLWGRGIARLLRPLIGPDERESD